MFVVLNTLIVAETNMEHSDITQLLIPKSDWASPDLFLYEGEDKFRLSLEGAIQYSGLNSIGGVVLGFRMIQYAVQLVAGKICYADKIPQWAPLLIKRQTKPNGRAWGRPPCPCRMPETPVSRAGRRLFAAWISAGRR